MYRVITAVRNQLAEEHLARSDATVMPGPRELTLRPEHAGNRPAVTVLAGPTAVGKGTVSQYIREHFPQVWVSVSATTRNPRPGEVDGTHYSFISHEEFCQLISQNKMLEWAEVQIGRASC